MKGAHHFSLCRSRHSEGGVDVWSRSKERVLHKNEVLFRCQIGENGTRYNFGTTGRDLGRENPQATFSKASRMLAFVVRKQTL
jgi:hypothetical protein